MLVSYIRIEYSTPHMILVDLTTIYIIDLIFLLSKNLGKKGCPGRNGKIRK